jgi:recombination protein RecR
MSSFLPKSIQVLIEEFGRLPGIGPKSAQRLAMHLLHSPESRSLELSEAVGGLKKGLQFCGKCWNIAESPLCRICQAAEHGERNGRQICVVEEILDVVAIEKTLEYKGVYHVLHGALSPVDGIGPEQLKIEALVERVKEMAGAGADGGLADADAIQHQMSGRLQKSTFEVGATSNVEVADVEVILATNPGLEGETTAMYLMRLLKPQGANVDSQEGVKITRIARGLPIGGDLDYADELTLTKAMQGRMEYK